MKSPHPASSFHSSSRTTTGFLAGLVLCGLPAVAPAQNSNPPQQITVHIHGVVLNAIDKRPIARALVTSNDQRMAMMTDSEGRFSFDVKQPAATTPSSGIFVSRFGGVGTVGPGMSVFLTVRRPGYLSFNSAIRLPTDPQQPAPEEVQLKLTPESILHGHLSVSSGAIPPGAQVQLYRKQVQDGTALWAQAGVVQVNGHGDYRFADLAAGSYKVMARASREGDNAQASDESSGYAPAYYADASDLASTPPLHLGTGETLQAELNLHESTLYHVQVPVPNAPKGAGINTTIGNQDELSGLFLAFNAQTQMLDGYLPNGTYDIRIFSYGQLQSSGRGRIEVAGKAVKAPPIALVPNGQIPVIVHQQYTATDSDQTQLRGGDAYINPEQQGPRRSLDVSLRPLALQASGANLKNTPNQGDDNLVLDNVQEGTYRVVARAFHGYIASISADGVDLLRQPLVVGPGGASGPIEVTLRDDDATLTGTVSVPDSLPSSSSSSTGNLLGPGIYLITCIPLGNTSATPPPQAVAFNGGKFTIPNLPPGDYLVLASTTSLTNLEYQNPDVVRKYQAKGTTVTLTPSQKAQIQVPLLPDSDLEAEN